MYRKFFLNPDGRGTGNRLLPYNSSLLPDLNFDLSKKYLKGIFHPKSTADKKRIESQLQNFGYYVSGDYLDSKSIQVIYSNDYTIKDTDHLKTIFVMSLSRTSFTIEYRVRPNFETRLYLPFRSEIDFSTSGYDIKDCRSLSSRIKRGSLILLKSTGKSFTMSPVILYSSSQLVSK